MKQGLSLVEMARELERRQATSKDYIADTRKIEVAADADRIVLMNGNGPLGNFGINQYAHRQLGEHLKIPAKFYDRMHQAYPDLLAHNLNELLRREPSRQMLRVLDGNLRAFVSDRFRALDNYDLANAVLPELERLPEIRIESTQFTETRFYLKAVFPRVQAEVKKGDVVQAGIVISNSEVGAGSLMVAPLVFRLVCLNGMVAQDYGQKRYHVGKKAAGELEMAYEYYSDQTKRLDDAALWAKVRDTVRGVAQNDVFKSIVSKMQAASEEKIESADIQEVVEVTANKFGYGESSKNGILKHLIEGGDLSRYGLMNAITRQSQDEEDYDVASKMEADGGRVIELARTDWQEIAKAA